MLLKEIYLYPDLAEYGDDVVHPFRDQSRSLCNFLERGLGAEKFVAAGFKRICIVGKRRPADEAQVNSSGALCVDVALDVDLYRRCATPEELNEFFIALLLDGLEKTAGHTALPSARLRQAIADFRRGGYRNEWIFKDRKIARTDYRCALACELTTGYFQLHFRVRRKDALILDTPIVRTAPDEVVFLPYLKDIKHANGKIEAVARSGLALYTTTVAGLDRL
ncbi:hypothetical protein [Xanthomonas tesorieronis]|uniref:hypothetical protein n=1 Tax=Xanthomonas tesorieronis TaxID=3160839 RepID=UPI00351855C7